MSILSSFIRDFSGLFELMQSEILRQCQEVPVEEILEMVIKHKRHFVAHKEYIDIIKRDPDSGLSELKDIQFCAAYMVLQDILGPFRLRRELKNLSGTNPTLTSVQDQMLKILLDLSKDSIQNLMSFIHDNDIFLPLFIKDNGQKHLSQIGEICKNDPIYPISLGYFSLQKIQKYAGFQRTIATRMDNWLAQQLSLTNFKTANKDPAFQKLILGYLENSSEEESAVADVVLKKCDSFGAEMQNKLWKALYNRSSADKKRLVIHDFIASDHTAETNKLFYTNFTSFLDAKQRAEILGVASDQQQQRYARLVKDLHLPITDIRIKKPQLSRETYLVWQLLETGKIAQSEILDLIQKAPLPDPKVPTSDSFLFQDKDRFYPDIFVAGCKKMKDSTYLLLRWIASFRKCPESRSWIATKWSELPLSLRQSENMILSLDNHFDLIYQAALRGDTGIINEVKTHLKQEDFKSRLTRSHSGKETVIHALCRQSKKGILKILSSFNATERQEILQLKNDMEQTPIDCCSADFYRYMMQGNFIRPEQLKIKEEEEQISAPEVAPEKTPGKIIEKTWRPMVHMPQFEKDLEGFALSPDVVAAAKQEIKELRSMPASELHLRMRQDIKKNIKNKPCVADFSIGGTAYRMGYVVKKGVLAPFFLMSHEHYNNELQNRRHMPLLTKLARRLAEDYQRT